MPYELDIVCLANSWKHGGRCIAGKIYSGPNQGQWVRPVSPVVGQRQITFPQMAYGQGQFAEVLDVIRIRFEGREEGTFQGENLIIANARWAKIGQITADDVEDWVETPITIWENGSRSTYGANDKIDNWRLQGARSSLCLITPERASVRVGAEHNGDTKVRVLFRYNGTDYAFTTTDVRIQEEYRGRPHGTYDLPNVRAMTVSLGERFPADGGHSYKLIAHIF